MKTGDVGEVLSEYFSSAFTKQKDVEEFREAFMDNVLQVNKNKEVLDVMGVIRDDKSPGSDIVGCYGEKREVTAVALTENSVFILTVGASRLFLYFRRAAKISRATTGSEPDVTCREDRQKTLE